MTPDLEAALKLAKFIANSGDGFHTKIENAKTVSRSLLDLHREHQRMREALEGILCAAAHRHNGSEEFPCFRCLLVNHVTKALAGSQAAEPPQVEGLCPVCGGKTTTLMPCPACTPQRNADAHTGYPMRDSEW